MKRGLNLRRRIWIIVRLCLERFQLPCSPHWNNSVEEKTWLHRWLLEVLRSALLSIASKVSSIPAWKTPSSSWAIMISDLPSWIVLAASYARRMPKHTRRSIQSPISTPRTLRSARLLRLAHSGTHRVEYLGGVNRSMRKGRHPEILITNLKVAKQACRRSLRYQLYWVNTCQVRVGLQ